MGALALEMRPEVQRALAACLDVVAGGLEQHREVTGEQLRPLGEHVAQAVELFGDLLALVERQRAVEARLLRPVGLVAGHVGVEHLLERIEIALFQRIAAGELRAGVLQVR